MFRLGFKHSLITEIVAFRSLALVAVTANLFFIGAVEAQQPVSPAAESADPSFAGVFMQMLPVYALVIAVYYLLVLKPQQKKQAALQELKSSLKKGDSVLTSSGIVARIVGIEDDFFSIEIAPNTKIKILASHVVGKPEDTAASEKNSVKAISNS